VEIQDKSCDFYRMSCVRKGRAYVKIPPFLWKIIHREKSTDGKKRHGVNNIHKLI
jgi:hypothetical protein